MGIWSQAKALAERTPPERNRYVDFLRAVSIIFVVVGHWLIATVYYVDGKLTPGHLLESEPGTHWLTWLFQVMPIFFIVGGYSNGVSLESARRREIGYGEWLSARLNRLVSPLLVLIFAWAAIAVAMRLLGFSDGVIAFTSRSAMIPTWFLAIYIMIVLLAPVTYAAWRRYGFGSFWVLASVAVATDLLYFMADLHWLGWSNYFWVWLSVHQLGFAWRDNCLGGPGRLLAIGALAFATLWALTSLGPYPFAMVGSPDQGVSNVLPPKVTLLVLGLVQLGVLLSIEGPMRRALDGMRLWTATVLVNSMIMTVYLWHMTLMIAVIAVLYYAGGLGLGIEPGTSAWWFTRPLWVVALFALLLPFALALSGFERRSRAKDSAVPAAWRQLLGAALVSLGVAVLAMFGYRGGPLPGMDITAFAMVVVGAWLSGVISRQ